ncbi:MAG: HindVP family restriction endonuclease [Kiritimatiellae bacterium]|nr:HindVP family restriction endonuclease [Kiritimatiellia bacterium]
MRKKDADTASDTNSDAALYGISHSNHNFKERIYWGKNQFNSSFPIALCCYMRDMGRNAVAIEMKRDLSTKISEMSFDEVFGTKLPNSELYFRFEAPFDPFRVLVEDSLEKIDVVIVNNATKEEIRPLEIKLTTLPDDGTSGMDESKYGSEIVVRSPTMRYVALSMIASNRSRLAQIKSIFEKSCKKVDNWENVAEMKSRQADIFAALRKFLSEFCRTQKPLLLQPVWKTIGKNPELAEHCLDVFVWTDFALTRLILDSLDEDKPNAISRPQRSAIRLARFLYEAARGDSVYQKPIYDGMTYDTLNDKEFAMSGCKTNFYMSCPRLLCPSVTKGEIKKIILGNPPFERATPHDFYNCILSYDA